MKNGFFLWETLSIENSLFHPHLFCATFPPIKEAGIAQTAVKINFFHPLIFSRRMLLQSRHLRHRAITILLHWRLVKTLTTDRFPQRQVPVVPFSHLPNLQWSNEELASQLAQQILWSSQPVVIETSLFSLMLDWQKIPGSKPPVVFLTRWWAQRELLCFSKADTETVSTDIDYKKKIKLTTPA